MTNNEYLQQLIVQKQLLFKNLMVLYDLDNKAAINSALSEYNALNRQCDTLSGFISNGMIDGDAEKK